MTVVIPQNPKLYGGYFRFLPLAQWSAQDWGNDVKVIEPFESDLVNRFRSVYLHNSPNPEVFERWCFEQWIYICEWMVKENRHGVFKIDSDVLLFNRILSFGQIYEGYLTLNDARQIPEAIIELFATRKAEQVCLAHGGAHVADMFLLRSFHDAHRANDLELDENLFMTHGQPAHQGHKDIWFVNGQPCWLRSKGFSRLRTVHCWGEAKEKMDVIYQQATRSRGSVPVRLEI